MINKFSNKIQRVWSKEWVLKFTSLCLAVLLWYFVGGEDVVEKNIMVESLVRAWSWAPHTIIVVYGRVSSVSMSLILLET